VRLSKRQRRLWQYMIAKLKAKFPPGVPVEVRTVDNIKIDGYSYGAMKLGRMVKIVIRINRKQPWKVKTDALLHEWAHSMEWSAHWVDGSPKEDHGETWGVWYAKIYRHMWDECWDEMRARKLIHPELMDIE